MARKPAKKPRVKPGTGRRDAARRREAFVAAYLSNGHNITQAAITAGYSPRTAAAQGTRLLKDVKVAALVAQEAERTAKKYELTADLAARSIYQELTFDPAKLYRPDGSLKDITELDEDTRMALSAVDFETRGEETTVRKVKWANRNQAREQLMKHLGMFERDNEQRRPTGLDLGGLANADRALLKSLLTAATKG